MPVKIFFCYAHEDEQFLEKLKGQLRPWQRQGLMDTWHDRDISAGTEWEPEIKKHLDSADIILLLISADFMDSDYCYSVEMQRALERHKREEVIVIPVIVRPVHWQQSELRQLQALPRNAIPVTSSKWHTLDEAFFNVADGIRKTVEELTARTVKQMPSAGNAQDEVRRNDEQSKTYNANLATPTPLDPNLLTNPSKVRPPSPVSQQWFRGKRVRIVLLLVPLVLLILVGVLVGVFERSLLYPPNDEKISHPQTPVPPEENIITKAQDGEYIGISNGRFAFDTQRLDGKLKIQAAEKLRANDLGSADSLWQQAVTQDTNDAETLIYLEDQRVLDSGNPYITIVIGTTLSGDSIAMAAGREATQAAYVAQKEYNTASTLPGGVQVRLLIASSGREYAYATTVAQQIVQLAHKDNHIVAVMGWTSTATTLNVIATLSSAQIPMVTNSGGDLLSDRSSYFFRVVPPASVQGQLGAMYAERRFHARTAAVFLDEGQNFMLSLANGFKSRFTGDGNTIVATELYTVGEPRTLPQLLQDALSKHPDVIYFAGYSGDVGGILAHLQPSDPPVVGGSSLYQLAFSPEARSGLAHLAFTATGYPDEWKFLGLKEPPFFTDYQADFDPYNKHATSPYGYDRPDGPTMEMFDAISVLLDGCKIVLKERSPLTRSNLQHALAEVKGTQTFQGVSSQISFDSHSNAIDRAIVFVCVGKKGFFQIDGIYGKFLKGEPYRTQILTPSACK